MKSNPISSLQWAFSPCPNDTFIFGPLAMGLLPSVDSISPELADIDRLNAIALQDGADVIKVSAAAYPLFSQTYQILPCGGAMGEGVGPLLVRRSKEARTLDGSSRVAHPGRLTTAYALFRLFHPEVTQLHEMIFSDIETAVHHGDATHGLLIHEGRFTYQSQQLYAEEDLGDRWETERGLPLPLGLILIKRALSEGTKGMVLNAIRESLRYAWAHPERVMPYVAAHAQEMDAAVQQKHIKLYVNRYTESIGTPGEQALHTLWGAIAQGDLPTGNDIFLRG